MKHFFKMSDPILKSEIEIDFPPTGNVAEYILEKVDSFIKSGGGRLECIVSVLRACM